MPQSLTKYLMRSPRYTLKPEDNSLVRVVGPKQEPWEEYTDIHNVSLTGLSFTVDAHLCPRLGEVIKLQFTVPSSQEMACFAIVTRLEQISTDITMVGIHFYKLDIAQRINLARGLTEKFQNKNPEKENVFDLKLMHQKTKFKYMMLFAAWTVLIAALFVWSIKG
ncbi:MAG: PilZ domain-containing protein [Pseudobdellovibrionaceae bacterium]